MAAVGPSRADIDELIYTIQMEEEAGVYRKPHANARLEKALRDRYVDNEECQILLRIPEGLRDHVLVVDEKDNLIADGYERLVVGTHGPYIEIAPHQINMAKLYIPDGPTYRSRKTQWDNHHQRGTPYSPYFKYVWWETPAGAKVYQQAQPVTYADYKPEYFYVSPFDVMIQEQLD